MSPFDPVGERARWRIFYDLLRQRDIGDVLTYEDMGAAVDLDPSDRHTIQMSFRRAAREYERVDNRAVEAVQNVGYRIVEPKEHLRLAKTHQKKSGRALERGHSKVTHVDLNGLELDTQQAFAVTARALSLLMDYSRKLDTRQDRLETAIDSMTTRTERTEDELASLKARLARLEERDT